MQKYSSGPAPAEKTTEIYLNAGLTGRELGAANSADGVAGIVNTNTLPVTWMR